MAAKYELPEEADEKLLETLGKEVEMKTFKTNIPPDLKCDTDEELFVIKILCLGGYTGSVGRKGVFIDDYLQVTPPVPTDQSPLIGCDFRLKKMRWRKSKHHKEVTTILQIWEMAEHYSFLSPLKVYFKGSHGALICWGPASSSSIDVGLIWMEGLKEICPSIPCVLVTNNISKNLRYGPDEMFKSELALDQFCEEHGFLDHFEIKFRDWQSGEKSIFGQAVNCLLDNIFH